MAGVKVPSGSLATPETRDGSTVAPSAVAVAAVACMGVAVPVTFLFRIPDNEVFAVPVDEELRGKVRAAVVAIRRLKETEELPEATEVRGRCIECEYANYCGDVW